ncbi:hypothetical protein MVES1_003795 [Malassezia vespertilionis]|uniref:Uncharacterized protein n=1 Tax=Malassezia vespertilionis TaxID=2020962 RepID=A0A2N1J828_9BASI|nr:uncharacterized protein MVES1_003795 [Malassezia vespertilionis]PKI82622.1 hypothetical protein MVES_003351 [Malassezia vespertilionis]WFD08422.1 hypothetical protein MVES1_003795 [Malassezia vespertilionis]
MRVLLLAGLLLACLAAARSNAHTKQIDGSNIPRVFSQVAQHIAKHYPSRVVSYNADDVHAHVALDDAVRNHRSAEQGWVNPETHGGSMLDLVGNGFREPMNVIISGKSDPSVLSDKGLLDYVRSIGFSFECLHIHLGGLQRSNLGDGAGWKAQLFEYRSLMFPKSLGVWVGSCWESLAGGNHFRVWRQNGTEADTGAWFLAVSKEENVAHKHTIVPNGYDIGRDLLVQAATKGSELFGKRYTASVDWQEGLLAEGANSINHNISIDGRVAVLTVQRV